MRHAALARTAVSHLLQPRGDLLCSPLGSRELSTLPTWLPGSVVGVWIVGRNDMGDSERKRQAGIHRLRPVHHRHAGGSRFWSLPSDFARTFEPGLQPHYLQQRRRTPRVVRWLNVVERWNRSGGGIFRVHLPDVSRKGSARRTRLTTSQY